MGHAFPSSFPAPSVRSADQQWSSDVNEALWKSPSESPQLCGNAFLAHGRCPTANESKIYMCFVVLMPFQRNHELYILSAKFLGEKTLLHQQELGKQRDLRLLVLSLCPDFLLTWVGSTVAVPVRFQWGSHFYGQLAGKDVKDCKWFFRDSRRLQNVAKFSKL